jgi:hypothetical protein
MIVTKRLTSVQIAQAIATIIAQLEAQTGEAKLDSTALEQITNAKLVTDAEKTKIADAITAAGVTAANLAANGDIGTVAGKVAAGDDTRMTDARTPTSHGNAQHSSTFVDAAGAVSAVNSAGLSNVNDAQSHYRITRNSTTQIQIEAQQAGTEDFVTVNGAQVSVATPKTLNTTANLLGAEGIDSGAAMALNTTYDLYLSNPSASPWPSEFRASAIAPTNGYLGTVNGANWKWVGKIYTNASVQFVLWPFTSPFEQKGNLAVNCTPVSTLPLKVVIRSGESVRFVREDGVLIVDIQQYTLYSDSAVYRAPASKFDTVESYKIKNQTWNFDTSIFAYPGRKLILGMESPTFALNGGMGVSATALISSGALSGATGTIAIDVPVGALLVGISAKNKVALVGPTNYSLTMDANAGSLPIVAAETNLAKNAHWEKMFAPIVVGPAVAVIDITKTGGDFSAGEIEAMGYYLSAVELTSYA